MDESLGDGFRIIAGLLGFLAVLIFAVFLIGIFASSERRPGIEIAMGVMALLLAVGAFVCYRMSLRKPKPYIQDETATSWRRLIKMPPWTDYLGFLGLPVLILGLPLLILASTHGQDMTSLKTWLLIIGPTLVFILILSPAFIIARREYMFLEALPEGLLVERRDSHREFFEWSKLERVRLRIQQIRNLHYGVMELHVGKKRPIEFREKMSDSLQRIGGVLASRANRHVEYCDRWVQTEQMRHSAGQVH